MQAEAVEVSQVGVRLAQARRDCGMSISDVAAHTKVSTRYLHAIESGALGQLPSRIHAIGFARSYARCVSLDTEEIGSAVKARFEVDSLREVKNPCESTGPDYFQRFYRSVKQRLFA